MPWRELLRAYWRLEARAKCGVDASSPKPSPPCVATASRAPSPRWSSAPRMPVNLTGILMPGERIAAILGNRVLYHQGIPVVARIKCYRLLRVAIPGNWIPASQPE